MTPERRQELILERLPLFIEFKLERIAEIGVWMGLFADLLLRHTPNIKEYVGVDPYRPHSALTGIIKHPTARDDGIWELTYNNMLCKLNKYKQFKLLRMTSHQASKLFDKLYFDLVYIDADHTYKSVRNDIKKWYPLIKNGGVMGGHDYGEPIFPGVKQAVNEFLSDVTVRGTTWMVIK